jgi:hypothetical protein
MIIVKVYFRSSTTVTSEGYVWILEYQENKSYLFSTKNKGFNGTKRKFYAKDLRLFSRYFGIFCFK